ncbi:MAG: DUF3429 domain-containing protein, partial [Pseudomonadota bacterium]
DNQTDEQTQMATGQTQVAAWVLAIGGLIPFWALALFLLAADSGELYERLALVGYGATILAFLGGIRWGVAITQKSADGRVILALSVLPSLAGWLTLLMPALTALLVLIACFIVQWVWDYLSVRSGNLPAWFGTLRSVITAGAVVALAIGAIGISSAA